MTLPGQPLGSCRVHFFPDHWFLVEPSLATTSSRDIVRCMMGPRVIWDEQRWTTLLDTDTPVVTLLHRMVYSPTWRLFAFDPRMPMKFVHTHTLDDVGAHAIASARRWCARTQGDNDPLQRGYHLPTDTPYRPEPKPAESVREHAIPGQRHVGRMAYLALNNAHHFLVHTDLDHLRDAATILHAFAGTTDGDERAQRNRARWEALAHSGEDPHQVLALLCRDIFRPHWNLYRVQRTQVWTLTLEARLNEKFVHPAWTTMGRDREAFDAFGEPDNRAILDPSRAQCGLPRQQTQAVYLYDDRGRPAYDVRFVVEGSLGSRVSVEDVLSLLTVGHAGGALSIQDRTLWQRLQETWHPPGVRPLLIDMIALHNTAWTLYRFNRQEPRHMRFVTRLDDELRHVPA